MKRQRRRIGKCQNVIGTTLVLFSVAQSAWWHRQLLWSGDAPGDVHSQGWLPITANSALYSQVHCVGDNFLPSAWTYKSCQYRNLYLSTDVNHSTQYWALYPSPAAVDLHQTWKSYINVSTHYARYSTSILDLTVLPTAIHSSHRRQKQTYSWAPTTLESASLPNSVTVLDRIAVPIFVQSLPSSKGQDPQFTFQLLTQILIPIYNLLALFGWEQETNSVDVYLLWSSHPSIDCDIKCQQWLRQGIEELLGYRLVVSHDHDSSPTSSSAATRPPNFCYRRGAAGMGFLSVQGLSRRGLETKDYQEPRVMQNVGRGGTFWDFVQHVWRLQQLSTTNHSQSNVVHVQLALSQNGSRTDKGLIQVLSDSFVSDPSIRVKTITTTSGPSISSLLQTARNSHVWIANAKDDAQTWPALFLPREATLCLLYDPREQPKGPSSGHASFPDFGFWNHVSHLRVHWLALPRNQKELNRLSNLIRSLILRHVHGEGDYSGTNVATRAPIGSPTRKEWTFQRHPLDWIQDPPPQLQAHCVGETWEWDVANYRSCLIHNLCFDTVSKEFVVVEAMNATVANRPGLKHDFLATTLQPVMMGQTIRFGTAEPWSPKHVLENATSSSYYALPSNVLWLPFFADVPNANNPGHLLWDFVFPLYTLMEMFGDRNHKVLLTNLDTDCIATKTKHACYKLTRKFLPLLGVDPESFFHAQGAELLPTSFDDDPSSVARPSNYVCSTNAAIGIGMLTDHGLKKHGQLINDYQNVRNSGRGVAFWRFRNHMIANLQLHKRRKPRRTPFVITFSINSSQNPSRSRDFVAQIQALQKFSSDRVKVQAVELGSMSLVDQMSVILESSVFVSVSGGAASTAMFLRRNSCLMLYFNDHDDFVRDMRGVTSMPAMLDWDFWNHASYLRVHWLPLSTMDNVRDLDILSRLIEAELESSW